MQHRGGLRKLDLIAMLILAAMAVVVVLLGTLSAFVVMVTR